MGARNDHRGRYAQSVYSQALTPLALGLALLIKMAPSHFVSLRCRAPCDSGVRGIFK